MRSEETPRQSDIPRNPDEQIAALVRDFQEASHDFLCEKELHAHFHRLGRDAYPKKYQTLDEQAMSPFRHDYETLWRYHSGDRFADRHRNSGSTATFDFALLQPYFIEHADYLTVGNKNEQQREMIRSLRPIPIYLGCSPIQAAIEIKMAARRNAHDVTAGDANRLEDRMLAACCKLAQERVGHAYVVGISHGLMPDLRRAQATVTTCLRLLQARYPDAHMCVLVATPTQTVLGGDWAEEVEWPNVVARGGWPVAQVEQAVREPGRPPHDLDAEFRRHGYLEEGGAIR